MGSLPGSDSWFMLLKFVRCGAAGPEVSLHVPVLRNHIAPPIQLEGGRVSVDAASSRVSWDPSNPLGRTRLEAASTLVACRVSPQWKVFDSQI